MILYHIWNFFGKGLKYEDYNIYILICMYAGGVVSLVEMEEDL